MTLKLIEATPRTLFLSTAILLLGCHPGLAQEDTFNPLGALQAELKSAKPGAAWTKQQKQCFKVQHGIARAVAAYNKAQNENRRDILSRRLSRDLVRGGFLKKVPVDPGQGPGSFNSYKGRSRKTGMTCRVHGSADAPVRGEQQACFRVQRSLARAITRYNRSQNTRVTEISRDLIKQLIRRRYLRRLPRDPGQGRRTWTHYGVTGTGAGIICSVHGPLK